MILKFLRAFSQLKIAILLLLVIAILSTLGTIIEQDQSLDFYKKFYFNSILPGNIRYWELIIFFGLHHIYQTWWFLFLIFLFSTCLISCTFMQQLPTFRLARRASFKFDFNSFKKQEYLISLKNIYFLKCLSNFKFKKYNIFQQKNITYCYIGIFGRFAPIIVHCGMLIILIGNIFSSLGSFNSQELFAKGEIYQLQNIIRKNFFTQILDFPLRVNDFWIEYGIKKNINQYYSDLSVLNYTGHEITRKTISVNFPLKFKDSTFYQTDWNMRRIRINLFKKQYQLPLNLLTKSKNRWITWIPFKLKQKDWLIFSTNKLDESFSLYTKKGIFFGTFYMGDFIKKYKELTIFEIMNETGLQIKADTGIFLVYFGFLILIISTFISYLLFIQFWFSKNDSTFFIGAKTNRANLNLQFEFLRLVLPFI